jgi:hypothetical protein
MRFALTIHAIHATAELSTANANAVDARADSPADGSRTSPALSVASVTNTLQHSAATARAIQIGSVGTSPAFAAST